MSSPIHLVIYLHKMFEMDFTGLRNGFLSPCAHTSMIPSNRAVKKKNKKEIKIHREPSSGYEGCLPCIRGDFFNLNLMMRYGTAPDLPTKLLLDMFSGDWVISNPT